MKNDKTSMLHIRVTRKEIEFIENQLLKYKFRSVSEYIRFLALNDWKIDIKRGN